VGRSDFRQRNSESSQWWGPIHPKLLPGKRQDDQVKGKVHPTMGHEGPEGEEK